MTELTAADVLADLFDSEDYLELTATDAATLVLKRLTDAGFEVRSAWPVEAKDTVTPHERWQPIETAPRDGTRILARGGALDDIEIISYSPNVGAWATPHYTLDDRDDEPDGYNRPRFWQPLPVIPPLAAIPRAERSGSGK